MKFPMDDSAPDYPALVIGNEILGVSFTSRLWDRLRQKEGWCYGTGSSFAAGAKDKVAQFRIRATCAPDVTDKVDKGALEELAKIIKDGITEDELKLAIKSTLAGGENRAAARTPAWSANLALGGFTWAVPWPMTSSSRKNRGVDGAGREPRAGGASHSWQARDRAGRRFQQEEVTLKPQDKRSVPGGSNPQERCAYPGACLIFHARQRSHPDAPPRRLDHRRLLARRRPELLSLPRAQARLRSRRPPVGLHGHRELVHHAHAPRSCGVVAGLCRPPAHDEDGAPHDLSARICGGRRAPPADYHATARSLAGRRATS